MDVANFPAIISQYGLLDANDIIIEDDLLLIGKKVNNLRDGSQYQELAITIEEFIKLIKTSIDATDLYVDANFGDDLTALPNRFDRPYRTIGAALSVAVGIAPATIYVRSGKYQEYFLQLQDNVNMYFEPGAIIQDTFFSDFGFDVRANILGYMDMTGSSYMSLSGESMINWEFNTVKTTFAFLICNPLPGRTLRINIHGKSVDTIGGFGYGAAFRGNTIGTLTIDDYFNSYGIFSTIHFRSGFANYTGNVTIKCPKIYLSGSGTDKRVVIVDESVDDDAVVNIYGDLINLNSNNGPYNAGLFCRRGKTTLYGNINYEADGGMGVVVDGGFGYGRGYVKVYGDIITKTRTAVFASHRDVLLFVQGGLIRGGRDGFYGPGIVIIGASMPGLPGMSSVWAYFKDCRIMQTEDAEIVNLTGNLPSDHRIFAYNTEFYHLKVSVSTETVISTSGSRTPGFVNCTSNRLLGAGITDFFVPTGYQPINNLIIPQF